jgi:hypothetical protein
MGLFLVMALSNPLTSQPIKYPPATSLARQEFVDEEGFSNSRVIQMGKDGLLLHAQSIKAEKGISNYRYSIINTNLQEVQRNILGVDRVRIGSGMVTKSVLGQTHFHQLFIGKKKFVLHSIPRSGSEKPIEVEGEFPVDGKIEFVSVLQEKLIITMRSKSAISLVFFDWKTGEIVLSAVTLPKGVKAKNVTILNFQELGNVNEIATVLRIKGKSPLSNLCVMHSADGELIRTIDISPREGVALIECRISAPFKNKFIFAGTYNNRLRTMSPYFAEGVFIAESDNSRLKYLTTTPFLDLKNFTDYMPENLQNYIDKRKGRADNVGKKLIIQYSMTIHPLASTADGYFLVGEAFYPQYHIETSYEKGKRIDTKVFDGNKYTHAILVKFDLNGKRVMDQCLSLKKFVPLSQLQGVREIQRFITLNLSIPNQIAMSYVADKYLIYKVFNHQGTELSQNQCEVIAKGDENEVIQGAASSLQHWYDANFVFYGYQTMKNADGKKRITFCIDKLRIEN